MKIKDVIENVLIEYPETRNDDTLLSWHVAKHYGVDNFITYEQFKKIPNVDTIKRWRRKFNEQGLYLPTDEKVIKKRLKNIEKWKKDLGYVY